MSRRFVRLWLPSVGLLILLLGLTALMWQEQQSFQTSLAERHVEDVGTQAARGLQEFVDLHLRAVELFAQRWSTHENRDFSRRRFDEFAAVMIDHFPGFHAWYLLSEPAQPAWIVDRDGSLQRVIEDPALWQAVQRAGAEGRAVLSAPQRLADDVHLYAVAPLKLDGQVRGALAAELRVASLLREGLHQRILAEFEVGLRDGDEQVYGAASRAGRPFEVQVATRRWVLDLQPRPRGERSASLGRLALPLLGALLSLLVAWLVHLVLRRAEVQRQALLDAMHEVRERERAEAALRVSEARYRGVFDAATDGMLVIDPEGTVLDASPSAGAILGREPPTMVGHPLAELLGPAGDGVSAALRAQIGQLGRAHIDAVIPREDGNSAEVELRGTGLRSSDVTRWLVTLTDVSERARALRRLGLLSRKVLLAQEEERGRLSRELHDELGQVLTALRLEMGALRKRLPDGDAVLLEHFAETALMVEHATAELRRICRGLRPPLLDDLGLEPAVQQLVREFEALGDVTAELELRLDDRWPVPPEIALSAYRILQESLTNVRRHAGARSVRVSLRNYSGELFLEVHDDGRGFDPRSLDGRQGCGVEGMRERAALVDGRVEIRSAQFQGTRVRFTANMRPAGELVGRGVTEDAAPADALRQKEDP